MAANGYGRVLIARTFIREKVPPISRVRWVRDKDDDTMSGGAEEGDKKTLTDPHWNGSYIGTILNDRRVLGEFQPKKKVPSTVSKTTKRKVKNHCSCQMVTRSKAITLRSDL